jgi:hypothetical protein
MKRVYAAMAIAALLGGCATPRSNVDQVQAGMSSEQVQSILGKPESSSNTPGQECSYYTVWKDFWSRVPWDFSDKYYVCYEDGKVASFGRATVSAVH